MIKAVVFDAYGTLLDVHSAMQTYADRLGPAWRDISQAWRTKHIEYTWVRTLANRHRHFGALMREALDYTAAKYDIHDPALLDELEMAYGALDAFADVAPTLTALRDKGLARAILTNGEPDMIAAGVKHAAIDRLLDAVLCIDPLGAFKPLPRVYDMVGERFGCQPNEVAFLSSNAWDAFGAREYGFQVFWVNRTGQPDEYGLLDSVTVLPGLAALPDMLA